MNTDIKQYHLVNKIADETFDLQQISQYNLYLAIGKNNVRAAVVDKTRNKFILLEDYELNNIFTPVQAAQQVQEILQERDFLGKPDWHQIRISIKNQSFTLMPETLFEAQAAETYLRLNCDLDTYHEQVYTYTHAGLDAVNIFAIDKYLITTLNQSFPNKNLQYFHQTSALIATLLHFGERNGQKKLYALVEKNSLTILVIQNSGLEFCNIFHYTTPEDFLYFLVLVMQEQKLNPEVDIITIWGDITHDSALFNLMRRYIRHVHFGSKPTGVDYSYKLEDLFAHRFFDVYSIHFCE